MQFDIRNRYTGAVQFTAEIDCAEDAPASVKIGSAVIWAAMTGANLRRADLSGADLSGADLRGADLRGADGVASLGAPDGWHAWCWVMDGLLSIRVGCKEMRLAEALEYWDRPEKPDRREVVAAVRYAEAIAIARGWALK